MFHKPIQFNQCSLSFNEKNCFEGFTAGLIYGAKIGIIGKNGCGKTSLLRMLMGEIEPSAGTLSVPLGTALTHVPQTIEQFPLKSGGERLFLTLQQALSQTPDVLLLDEPTNHLDHKNRAQLFKILKNFPGTLCVVSHDPELLRLTTKMLWVFDHSKIRIFSGHYDDWCRELEIQKTALQDDLKKIQRQKKEIHESLMQEQERASKSRRIGEKNTNRKKVLLIQAHTQRSSAQAHSGRKKYELQNKKQELHNQLANLPSHEIIRPQFLLTPEKTADKTLLTITGGEIGYPGKILLTGLYFSLSGKERIAIKGSNGSGKTTFLKALLRDPNVMKSGQWFLPNLSQIGYLDQHYATLAPDQTVLRTIESLMPGRFHAQHREHLNRFLFRKNEEVAKQTACLSGGEKVRLSLAIIGAATPRLLILDEITNNLDLEIRQHVIQVITEYPGALLVVSHDEDFLSAIGIKKFYEIKDSHLCLGEMGT